MANISVLLHVSDRKKAVTIPSSCTDHCNLLRESVAQWTGESVAYFERYDSEWDEWIEVDSGFQANNKDRIKAVIPTHENAAGSSEVTLDKSLEGINKVMCNHKIDCGDLDC